MIAIVPVLTYHQASKHHLDRYAPGPPGMEWASQPDPFRRYEGAPQLALPLADGGPTLSWAALHDAKRPPPASLTLDSLAGFLQYSLGLSAWKSYGGERWALRCNPSSGNLHPTECSILCPALPGLDGGVYHYRPDTHGLEQRAAVPLAWADGFFVALSGIYWREAWKYGLRAFRYCQLDSGHALAGLSYAAALYGWPVRLRREWSDSQIETLCGLDRDDGFFAEEPESAEALLWVGPGDAPDLKDVLASLAGVEWRGRPNRLSATHRAWPAIGEIAAATRYGGMAPAGDHPALGELPPLKGGETTDAARLIAGRRSAQAFDGETAMAADAFYRLLDALLPRPSVPPWALCDEVASVHPLLFVHRIEGLPPGLYCLPRTADALADLRSAMRPDWLWERVAAAPEHLPLYLLAPLDVRSFAATASCHQDIASDSAFSLAMLARFDDIDAEHPWRYRDRFREAGMLGQVLYLEAEAAGLRGTGIGCFFDDVVHRALGLDGERFQDIYHFTVGGAVLDPRLVSEPAYRER